MGKSWRQSHRSPEKPAWWPHGRQRFDGCHQLWHQKLSSLVGCGYQLSFFWFWTMFHLHLVFLSWTSNLFWTHEFPVSISILCILYPHEAGWNWSFSIPEPMVGCTRHRFTPSTFERSSPLLSLRSSWTFPSPSSGSVPELRIAWKCTTKREDKRRLAHHWGNPQNYPYKKGYIKAPCYKMTVWYSRNIQENANPNLQCNELLLLMISWSWASSYQYILNCFIYINCIIFVYVCLCILFRVQMMHKYA